MTYAAQLIEAVKAARGLSDTGVAKALGVKQPTVSQWKHAKGSPMSAERVLQLCDLAGITSEELRGYWLTGVMRDAVTTTGVMRALDGVLDRVRPVVKTAGMLAVALLVGFAPPSRAMTDESLTDAPYRHYAKLAHRILHKIFSRIRENWAARSAGGPHGPAPLLA